MMRTTPRKRPTVRLHLWLETDEGVVFGIGRAMLLMKVGQYGSLKEAAADLGMSYRAAWGKIRKTEEILGAPLIVRNANKRKGYDLTDYGRLLTEKFMAWFHEIEDAALEKAGEAFEWRVKPFEGGVSD
jgi:molybdate transport system regulatory protein